MYDQYIVGFMMIGGIGLGILCGKDTSIIYSFQFGKLLTIPLLSCHTWPYSHSRADQPSS